LGPGGGVVGGALVRGGKLAELADGVLDGGEGGAVAALAEGFWAAQIRSNQALFCSEAGGAWGGA